MSNQAAIFKRALNEIETLRRRVAELEDAASPARAEPVAVVGMACRMPGGVSDPEGFWDLLARGVDATREAPTDRWPADAFFAAEPTPGKAYVRRGGYLDDVSGFDPAFFGLSPREIQRMDPQQRLLLETSWEALERAGQPIDALVGSATGVFVGNTTNDFSHLQMKYVDLALLDAHYVTGNFPSFLAGRIAFHFGLQGPVLAVDTACSSSLVAVHLACQSLGQGECSMAMASGVNLLLLPELQASLCGARMLAPDGRCKTFDARADGYARAEGCATVVLKRLADAQAAGDPVLAVIRGSAINHDGRSSGITVPNGDAQQGVLRDALARAGVDPHEVDYIEAHGTGTALGDPIEVRALAAVLGAGRETPLMLGSVKTNVGHLEAAAGIAGLIKVILSLEAGELPPHLHLDTLNPAIDLEAIPAQVVTERQPWPSQDGDARIAGVSSFGASGTNAHVVVSAPPSRPQAHRLAQPDRTPIADRARVERAPDDQDGPALLALSAQDEGALRQLAGRYARHLEAHPEQAVADICATANITRPAFRHRLALHASTRSDMAAQLAAVAADDSAAPTGPAVHLATLPRRASRWGKAGAPVAFLFTGQGSQYPDMGRGLYDTEPTFRRAIERCDAGLRDVLEQPLVEVLYGRQQALLDQTAYTQPALFALEYALAETWRCWGVTPAAVLGHSVGEYVAAWMAGVVPFDQALHMIATRARLMQALPAGGGMVAVNLDEAVARAAIADHPDSLSLAAINGPRSTVLSGDHAVLDEVVATLVERGVKAKPLTVSHAFHSPLVAPMLADFEAALTGLTPVPPRIDVISNLSGGAVDAAGRVDGEVFGSAAYWCRHVREPVRFADGLAALAGVGVDVLVEIGPAPVLLGMGRQCTPAPDPRAPEAHDEDERVWVPTLRKGRDDRQQMLDAVAELFVRGATIDWQQAGVKPHDEQLRGGPAQQEQAHGEPTGNPGNENPGNGVGSRRRVALPTYPFQRRRFWIEPDELASPGETAPMMGGLAGGPMTGGPSTGGGAPASLHPFLAHRVSSPLAITQYATVLSTEREPMLADFAIFGHVVVNIGVYVEAFAAAARDAIGVEAPVIDGIAMPQALLLGDGKAQPNGHPERAVQVVVGADRGGERSLEVFALPAADGTVSPEDRADESAWTLYASASLRGTVDGMPSGSGEACDHREGAREIDGLRAAAVSEQRGEDFYAGMTARGIALGPAGRWIEHVWRGSGEPATALARMRRPLAADQADRFGLHPGLIDCCFQLLYATLTADEDDPQALFMLVGVERLGFTGWSNAEAEPASPEPGTLWCRVSRDASREGDEAGQVVAGDILLATEHGQPVLTVVGAELRRVSRSTLERSLSADARRPAAGRDTEAARQAAREAVRAASPEARAALVHDGVIDSVARVVGVEAPDVDPHQPLSELGFDSLLALELRTAIGNRLGVAPPPGADPRSADPELARATTGRRGDAFRSGAGR